MTKSFVQLAMFSLLIALASSAAAQATASTPEETPFLHGFDVSINGNAPVHFGLDTGAAIDFLITPEKAQQLGLPITGHRNIRTSDRQPLGSGDTVSIVKATTLKVAGRTFTPAEGDILKMSDSHRDGTLGITLFRDVLLTLDYPHDRLNISDGELPPPNGRDVIEYSTKPDATFGPLRVSPTVTIQLAGHTLPALFDSAAAKIPADVIVPTTLAATLPLGRTESETVISDAAGHRYPSRTARLNGDLILGEVVLHNPTVLVSDWLGFVNLARIWNRLIITIDQRNHRLRITMPSKVPPEALATK